MNKGSRAAAPTAKPTEGKNKPAGKEGGKVFFGYAAPGRKGKSTKKMA
jgi:hypothetical protein